MGEVMDKCGLSRAQEETPECRCWLPAELTAAIRAKYLSENRRGVSTVERSDGSQRRAGKGSLPMTERQLRAKKRVYLGISFFRGGGE
jgi:hypothetical protein